MNSNIFDKFSFVSLCLVVVLLPVFCLPFTSVPVEISKGLLLVIGLAFSVIFWSIARFMDGKIVLPKSWLLVSGGGIVLTFLLSTLFSGSSQVSLFGTMFDIGSFWFIFASFILMLMSAVIFRTPKQAKIALFGIVLSSFIVLIFQSLFLFFPKFLSLGILTTNTANLFGSWNALGLFAGFATLLFLLIVEFFPISKIEKIALEVFTVLSILLAVVVNFPLVWVLLGVSSLIIFVYKVSLSLQRSEEEREKKNFPMVSFIVVMVSLLFFMSGPFISSYIPERLQILNTEVSPSIGSTFSVTKGVLSKDPVFGVGPNRFGEMWSMYKPMALNGTQFWDVSFDSGSGLIPTLMSTTGILAIIAWITFFILFLFIGLKSVFSSIKNGENWEIVALFVLSLYLFIASFFYSVGVVILLLSLAFAGMFVGLVASNTGKELSISFLNDHRKSFFSILTLIVVLVFSVGVSFRYIERFVSVTYFQKAVLSETEGGAENFINKALSLYSNDLYLRTYAQVYLIKLNTLANKGSELTEAEKADLQTNLNQAVNGSKLAVSYDPLNYLNSQLLGSLYQTVGVLGVKDAYSNALLAYQEASRLNPLNPRLKLAMASVSFADKKIKEAKDYAKEALSLKGDYIDALITLSQIAKSEGNNSEALSYGQKALSLSPKDKNLIQYVNTLSSSTSSSGSTSTEKTKK
ncbi:hypothetical protein IT399_00615 [Candidatus Nomurabacteria bacterium]|nr:hypothetical protein [Candidatus Nomurabacteria bacterium]